MKIFVPRYRHNMPHLHPEVLTSMLAEVDEPDLHSVIKRWHELDTQAEFDNIGKFYENVKEACERCPQKHTLEPFLRRPHITVHAGSKEGKPHCRAIVRKVTYDAGRLVAHHGFNLWYGGGNQGLMGAIIEGFNDGIKAEGRRDDQYAVQILPARFAVPQIGDSANGLHAVNENLYGVTDAAIVMPDFVTRRELLDSRAAAAITCPGGIGSLDEWSDMAVHIKTGLRHIYLYTLNPYIEKQGCGYYDLLRQFVASCIENGLENPAILDHIYYRESAEQVFADLMPRLKSKNAEPDQIYAAYCQRHGVSPGIPKKRMKPAAVAALS